MKGFKVQTIISGYQSEQTGSVKSKKFQILSKIERFDLVNALQILNSREHRSFCRNLIDIER